MREDKWLFLLKTPVSLFSWMLNHLNQRKPSIKEQTFFPSLITSIHIAPRCISTDKSTVLQLNDDTAPGTTYCIAHHQTIKDEVQKLMIANIKYHDSFVKQNGKWLFDDRKLLVD